MKKLIEVLDSGYTLDESQDGSLTLKVPFMVADQVNSNKRKYPEAVLRRSIEELKKKLARQPAYGSTAHRKDLAVDDISHIIEDAKLEGKTGYAVIRVLPTSKGKNVLAIIKGGGKLGISTRGYGETKNEAGVEVVCDNYELLGLDFVLNPSLPLFAGKDEILESAPLEENENYSLSENDLDTRYWNAVRFANYQGTKEDLQATIEDEEGRALLGTALERYRRAREAGYTGDFDSFVNSLPKEKT